MAALRDAARPDDNFADVAPAAAPPQAQAPVQKMIAADPQPQQHRQHDVIISQRPAVSPIRSPTARPNDVDDVEVEALSRAVARFMMGQYTRAHAQARRDTATASLASDDEQRRIVAVGFEAFVFQLPRLADDL